MFTLTAFWSRLGKGAALACALTAGAGAQATVIDPNTAASPYSGAVSIEIQNAGVTTICSGALIGTRSVATAGSCVDANGNGTAIDLSQAGNVVTVIFNSAGDNTAQIAASSISLQPNFQGKGVCPSGSGTCYNDNLSVLTLSADAPASAQIYAVSTNPVTSGTTIVMAGYGNPGDGVSAQGAPSFFVKRTGANQADLFESDDEQNFTGGANEVFYADFDGGGRDTFCTDFSVCTGPLPSGIESTIGSGDEGAPVFVMENGQLALVGISTFFATEDGVSSTFGTYFVGTLLAGYADYLTTATNGTVVLVPEPGSVALMGLGVLLLVGARRRTRKY